MKEAEPVPYLRKSHEVPSTVTISKVVSVSREVLAEAFSMLQAQLIMYS